MTVKYFILPMMILFSFVSSAAQWEEVYEEEGIKVWEKYIEGSSVVAFRGEAVISTNIHQLFSVLYDADHKKDFLQNVIEFRNLQINGPYEGVNYIRLGNNIPFIDDRDVILESKIITLPSQKKIVVNFSNSNEAFVPLQEDTVRIPKLKGFWSFEALGLDKTKVFYQVESDPGGLIPKWLVNLANKRLPFNTIKKMRDLSKKDDVFKKTATMIKYFFDFKPFLGKDHPSVQRSRKEAKLVEQDIKASFKLACEAGMKDACSESNVFRLKYLKEGKNGNL
ncbi:MAG: hypothetical protein VYD54_10060 [Bdellovibrionota bacterium]|nr:hypothetical protein [Bdellovibrionota bacterium]